MKKFYLILFILIAPHFSQGQTKAWIEFDGMYGQKSADLSFYGEQSNLYQGTFRTWIGKDVGKSWSLGLLGNYGSYTSRESDFSTQTFITSPGPTNPGEQVIVGFRTGNFRVALQNKFMSYGFFLRKERKLTEKISLDLNFTALHGQGNSGTFEVYPAPSVFFPCVNCLSMPGVFPIPMEESLWRFGFDLGFSYAVNTWISLGLRANMLEFQKRTISRSPDRQIYADTPDPFYNLNYGDRYDFGTAIMREGVRVSVRLKPFSTRKGEAQ